MRSLLLILFSIPVFLFAQVAQGNKPPQPVPSAGGNVQSPPEITPETVNQGVIKVRRNSVRPYFKCEYYLTLARVQQVQTPIIAPDGSTQMDMVPWFDSSFSQLNERVYPLKSEHFSRKLWEQSNYKYSFDDSTSVDTMRVQLWIGKNGKIRWKNPDTTYNGDMPAELEAELYSSIMNMTEWGTGGGYMTPKKFLRKQKRMAENYYCVMYIIASSKPLTTEQKATDSHYAPFDLPLNSPPGDQQEKKFIEGNRNPKDDSLKR